MTGESSSGTGSVSMQQFFSDVELVKKHILVIRNSTKRVADINQQVVLATTSESEHEESQELQLLVTETNKKAAIAKQLLKKLNEETEGLKGTPGNNKQSEIRIRENLSNTLTRKFVDVMKEYQSAQTKYKTDIKKKVKRQVQIIKPDATQEEIDAVLQAGGGSGELMKAAILKVHGGYFVSRVLVVSHHHQPHRAMLRTPSATPLKTWRPSTRTYWCSKRRWRSCTKCFLTLLCSPSSKESCSIRLSTRSSPPRTISRKGTRRLQKPLKSRNQYAKSNAASS